MMAEIEGTVNQRPLTYVESDSLEVIRPVDFISPRASLLLHSSASGGDDEYTPQGATTRTELLKQWARTQEHLQRFWETWQHSYLATLRERAQFVHSGPQSQTRRPPRVGEVVLINEANIPRGAWKLGLITETPTGTGNVIRSAELRTATGRTVTRPISLLYPLEVDCTPNMEEYTNPGNQPDTNPNDNTPDLQRRVTRSMTISRAAKPDISCSAILTLTLVALITTVIAKSQQWAQICPFQHTGTYMQIPPIINCTSFVNNHWKVAEVEVYKRSIVPIPATYCSRVTRTVCTWAFLRLSIQVINDTHTVESMPFADCMQLHATHRLDQYVLHPSKSAGRREEKRPYRMAWCDLKEWWTVEDSRGYRHRAEPDAP